MNGRCYYTGHCCADYVFHVANRHPLISCCCVHTEHPYSRVERCTILAIISGLTFLSCAAGNFATKAVEHNVGGATESTEGFAAFCLTNIGLLCFVTLPLIVLQMILEALVTLDFTFEEAGEKADERVGLGIGSACGLCASLVRCCKNCCLCYGLLLTAACVGLAEVACSQQGTSLAEIVPAFAASRLQSWLLWFPIDFFLPCCGFLALWQGEEEEELDESDEDAGDAESAEPSREASACC